MRLIPRAASLTAAVLALLAGPALATAPYTVSVGGDTIGTNHPFSAAGPIIFTVHNSGGDRVFTCRYLTLIGMVHTGTGVANPIASITYSTWDDCPFGAADMVITSNHTPPWTLNGTGTATAGTSDDVAATIGSVNAQWSWWGGACTFTTTGSINAVVHEGAQTLELTESAGNLTISNTSFGCFGQISNGNKADLVGTLPLGWDGPVYLS